jgi:myo-inositol-1(or 4)-monophosphatase
VTSVPSALPDHSPDGRVDASPDGTLDESSEKLDQGLPVADLIRLAERVAREAGALIRERRPRHVQVAATKSSPTDVVTEMDRAAESLLRSRLAAARPDDGLHGEEQGVQPGGSGITWLIDPIDGTVNYLYGIPAFAVSVAAVLGDSTRPGGWRSVAGCVYSPADGRTWTAGAGLGAFLDGARLHSPDPPPLARALVATGFGYRAGRRAGQSRVLAGLLPRVRDIRRIGCSAIDLCMVATGQVDAYYERGLNPWDFAASRLVATEAGAVVRGIDGRPAGEHMVVAGRAPLVEVLADELEALDAGGDDPEV